MLCPKVVQHAASHTTAVQPSSHDQTHVLIGKQWYQLPELVPTNSNSGLHSCISVSIHTQEADIEVHIQQKHNRMPQHWGCLGTWLKWHHPVSACSESVNNCVQWKTDGVLLQTAPWLQCEWCWNVVVDFQQSCRWPSLAPGLPMLETATCFPWMYMVRWSVATLCQPMLPGIVDLKQQHNNVIAGWTKPVTTQGHSNVDHTIFINATPSGRNNSSKHNEQQTTNCSIKNSTPNTWHK